MVVASRLLLRFSTSDFLEFQLAVHRFEDVGEEGYFLEEVVVF
jgi:hypothetical protein